MFSYCWQKATFFSFIIAIGVYYMPMIITCCHFLTACEREMYAITAKRPRQDSSCETFSLTVRGRRNYELLSRIRDSLEMTEQLVPHGERDRYVQQRRQSEYVYNSTPSVQHTCYCSVCIILCQCNRLHHKNAIGTSLFLLILCFHL